MMIKDLLYKEFKLAMHPTVYIFLGMGAMLLIPSYPYYVAFIYTCLAIFFIFLSGRENKDVLFTVALPVNKRDTVKARCYSIAMIEVTQMIVSIPFAIIGHKINPNPLGNLVGIEANVAFYGFVCIMFALFNAIYIPKFYKTAYNAGVPLLVAGIAITVYIVAVEVAVQKVPFLKSHLDTFASKMMARQLTVLIGGMVIFGLCLVLAYRKAARNFEKIDL